MRSGWLFAAVILAGCSSNNVWQESRVDIPPLEAGQSVEVEEVGGNLVCVTEADDPTTRTCVPIVHGEDEATGGSR
jgi:hypothetical protein